MFLTVNGTRLKVDVPVKSIFFKRAHELFDHKVIIGANIITSFHEVGNMLADFLCHQTIETSVVGSLLASLNDQSFENMA